MVGLVFVAICLVVLPAATCDSRRPDASAVERVFGRTGLGPGEFSYPRALAVSPNDGCVFVVDKTARVQRFSAAGSYEHQWRMPEYASGKPVGLFVDDHDRVWVPDTHYSRVIVYDRDGRERFRFGERGMGPGQFIFPTAVALDRDGNIYVGEYGENDRISKFSPQRRYLFSFADAASGEGAVIRPTQIVIDKSGLLWVADSCHHRICRYDSDGHFLSAFGLPGTGENRLNYPFGLALERGGTILVADQGNNRIVRYDRSGTVRGSWGSAGRPVGQLLHPWDVALGRNGSIYVLDSWNNRVQVLNWSS